mgnify:CR=1 FL=1
MIVYVVPIDSATGKLNAKKYLGGRQKLSEFQTDFANKVASKHGLERGVMGSKANHQTIKEYYAAVSCTLDNSLENDDYTIPEPRSFLQSKAEYAQDVKNELLQELGVATNVSKLKP